MAIRDEVRLLQKRARDKEYRLRKQGADQHAIAQESPRLGWNQVKGLSSQQLKKYARDLDKFNSRSNALVTLQSGDVVAKSVLMRAEAARKSWNKKALKEKTRIEGLAAGAAKVIKDRQYVYGKNARNNVLGAITEIAPMNQPRTKRGAIKRAKQLESMVARGFDKRRTQQRTAMVSILNQLGEHDLANSVANMQKNRFDMLSTISNIWSMLDVYYIPKEKDGRVQTQSHNDTFAAGIRENIYHAQAYGLGDKEATAKIKKLRQTEAKRKAKAEKAIALKIIKR